MQTKGLAGATFESALLVQGRNVFWYADDAALAAGDLGRSADGDGVPRAHLEAGDVEDSQAKAVGVFFALTGEELLERDEVVSLRFFKFSLALAAGEEELTLPGAGIAAQGGLPAGRVSGFHLRLDASLAAGRTVATEPFAARKPAS